jgi:phosphate transport system permease protein
MAKIENELHPLKLPVKKHHLLTKTNGIYYRNRIFKLYSLISAVLLGLVLLAVIVFIGKTGLLVFKDVSVKEFFFSIKWEPDQGKFGAAIFIIGTFLLTALTMVMAVPLSILLAIFLVEMAPGWLKSLIRPVLDLIVGIPSIVFGYLGLTVLIPFLMKTTGSLMGDGLLAAAITLTIMVLPTVTTITADAIAAVSPDIKEASYALGSTRLQSLFRVILPAAKSGIFTAIILGMARAIGETMAVVMVIGNTAQLAKTLLTPTAVLTSNIVMQILDVEFNSTWNYALYMMAFILLIVSNLMIIAVRRIRAKGVSNNG